jgi:hypothetical protein
MCVLGTPEGKSTTAMTHSTECNAPGAPLIPRGVRKSQYAKGDWFDVWLPNLAPSAALIRQTQIGDDGSGSSMTGNDF